MPGYGPIASYPIMAPESASEAVETQSLPLMIAHQSGRYPGGWSVFAAGLALSISMGTPSAIVPTADIIVRMLANDIVVRMPADDITVLMPPDDDEVLL